MAGGGAAAGRAAKSAPATAASTSRGTSSRRASGIAKVSAPRRGDSSAACAPSSDRALSTDDGARRLGELGIGTNYGIDRAIGTILFDEKLGGTVHVALGRSYPETGGRNQSALHWDLICDLRRGGRITADGEVVQEDGRFVVAAAQ